MHLYQYFFPLNIKIVFFNVAFHAFYVLKASRQLWRFYQNLILFISFSYYFVVFLPFFAMLKIMRKEHGSGKWTRFDPFFLFRIYDVFEWRAFKIHDYLEGIFNFMSHVTLTLSQEYTDQHSKAQSPAIHIIRPLRIFIR